MQALTAVFAAQSAINLPKDGSKNGKNASYASLIASCRYHYSFRSEALDFSDCLVFVHLFAIQ